MPLTGSNDPSDYLKRAAGMPSRDDRRDPLAQGPDPGNAVPRAPVHLPVADARTGREFDPPPVEVLHEKCTLS